MDYTEQEEWEIGHLRRPPPVAGAEEVDEKRGWGDTVTGQTFFF
jgi:hypothetical protein